MFLTAKSSTTIVWFSRIRLVVNLWRKSLLASAIFACAFATLSLALRLLFDFNFFLDKLFWAALSLLNFWLKWRGLAIFSPLLVVTKILKPISSPTLF